LPRWWKGALLLGAGISILAAICTSVLTVIVARMVVTPPRRRTEDVRVLAVDLPKRRIVLSVTADSIVPGHYSFWFADGLGHARLGDVLDLTADSVTREILLVDFGNLARARHGRFSGWFYLTPSDLQYPFENVQIETTLGPAPAWLIPAEQESSRWVIQVHGRAVNRSETLRAVPVFRAAGFTSLLVSYRNDEDAPSSIDGRYGLGDTEWFDVDAALHYAVDHGAREVVLMGWSMGGATVLQAATRSSLSDVVVAVVLESPVVDWVTALEFQAKILHLPRPIGSGVLAIIGRSWGRRLTGQAESIDLRRLDFVRRAAELHLPILILHSDDDGYVPSTASHSLARARPDIVTLEAFTIARHTKLWNYDPDRWNRAIDDWLDDRGLRPRN
jgi:alpha-beta hydrolase superfamily lysophospholipase